MKKDKKMMAMMHRVNEVMKKSEELSRCLKMKVVEMATGRDSATVALSALARTVFDVVDAQMATGHKNAMKTLITLLEGEIQAKLLEIKLNEGKVKR